MINRRKFDIRIFALLTSINGTLKAYFYEDGYLRTSCREFSLQNVHSKVIHLTNDAIQKKSEGYGKYENGNKLGFQDFQKYIDSNYSDKKVNFTRDILSQIKVFIKSI